MKRDDIIDLSFGIFLIVVVITLLVIVFQILEDSHKSVEPHPTYIDTTKVQVLYEDTWGKILFVKEEDL